MFPSSLGNLEYATSAGVAVTGPQTVTWLLANEILSSGTQADAGIDVMSGSGLNEGICDLIIGTHDDWPGSGRGGGRHPLVFFAAAKGTSKGR